MERDHGEGVDGRPSRLAKNLRGTVSIITHLEPVDRNIVGVMSHPDLGSNQIVRNGPHLRLT